MPEGVAWESRIAGWAGLSNADAMTSQMARDSLRDAYSWSNMRGRMRGQSSAWSMFDAPKSWSQMSASPDEAMTNYIGNLQARRGSIGASFWQGAKSAILPVEGFTPGQLEATRASSGMGMMGKAKGTVPKGIRATAGRVLGAGMKVAGPLMTGHRIATETQGMGLLGGMEKSGRIIGEEMVMTGSMFAGMSIGASAGMALGPGGAIIGGAIGLGVGMVGGMAGSWALNKAIDVAEVPFRLGASGFKHFANRGRDNRLELGGGVSAGNRTRAAYTMRQRALQGMNRSGMNARSLLGREASMCHIR